MMDTDFYEVDDNNTEDRTVDRLPLPLTYVDRSQSSQTLQVRKLPRPVLALLNSAYRTVVGAFLSDHRETDIYQVQIKRPTSTSPGGFKCKRGPRPFIAESEEYTFEIRFEIYQGQTGVRLSRRNVTRSLLNQLRNKPRTLKGIKK